MWPTGGDQPGRPSGPVRPFSPFAAPPPSARPLPSFPGTAVASERPGAPPPGMLQPAPGSAPSIRFNGPSAPPPLTSQPPRSVSNYPQFPAPQFASGPQVGYPQRAPPSVPPPPVGNVPFQPPPTGPRFPPPPPVSHVPSIPMGPPMLSRNEAASTALGGNVPQLQPGDSMAPSSLPGYPPAAPPSSLDSSYSAPRPFPQQSFQSHPAPPGPRGPYPFNPQQGGFGAPPPGAPPAFGNIQGLVEEFQSLNVKSAPGSVDAGIDIQSLPRPTESDIEPKNLSDAFPLNCHPRYFKLTTHAVPNSQSLFARWHLPLGAVIQPLAEAPDGEQVPVVNFGSAGVIRCRRCRTYINPYATFTDAGWKWRCNLCSFLNDVPREYFCALDPSGRRADADQRPELSKGSVELVAPTEYMVRPPMPPLYFFLIDVSISAVRSGMLEVVAKTIKSCLNELPGFPRTQIGFITFDSTVHFYNMKSSLTQPQMMVVADIEDLFAPLPDDLLVNLSDSRNVVDAFLDSLSTMFQDNINVESAFGPALKAAYMVMSQLGGKLLIFQSTLPSLGIGRLKLRGEDLRIYGTDKEHTSRIPEDPFYKQMAAEFTKQQIAVDVYAFSERYCDVASLGSLAKYTGGQVYYYPSFQASLHGERLRHDLARDLTRETAWESVMRIRCGKGVRFTTYHGHFMLRSTDLMALPAVDCDKAFAAQFALEDTLITTPTIYFQVALLYTSSSGERRIRVHTAAAPVVVELSEMYRQADTGAVVSLISKLAIEKTLSQKLEDARQFVQLKIVKSLKEYRNLYAVQHRLGGRLIYPESLKFLPLYGLALCKSLALRGGYAEVELDERCAAGYSLMILPVKRTLKLLYPSLTKIDDSIFKGAQNVDDLPPCSPLPLTAASLNPQGLYLYDDGFRFVLWIGGALHQEVVANILGFYLSSFPDLSKVLLTEHNNDISKGLMKILRSYRESEPSSYQLCHIVRQGEQPRELSLLLSNLVEDQMGGMSSYLDWVVQLYRQTQQNP